MTATTKIAQITFLCTGLFIANSVWSKDCVDGPGVANSKKSASQSEAYSVKPELNRIPLSAAERQALFRDASLNKPDELGDYTEDYLALYPH